MTILMDFLSQLDWQTLLRDIFIYSPKEPLIFTRLYFYTARCVVCLSVRVNLQIHAACESYGRRLHGAIKFLKILPPPPTAEIADFSCISS